MATNNSLNLPLSGSTGTGAFVGSNGPVTSNVTVDNLNLSLNTISSTNTDGNIAISPNGSGVTQFANPISVPQINNPSNSPVLAFEFTGTTVNYFRFDTSVTGSPVSFQSYGADTDVGLNIEAKGAGIISFITDAVTNPIIIQNDLHLTQLNFGTSVGTRVLTFQDASGTVVQDNSGSGSITTSPPVSQTPTLTIGTAYQNLFGYDVVLTIYLSVTALATNTILLGISPSPTPGQQTIMTFPGAVTAAIIPVTIYLPTNYFALLSTVGATVTIIGQQAMPV